MKRHIYTWIVAVIFFFCIFTVAHAQVEGENHLNVTLESYSADQIVLLVETPEIVIEQAQSGGLFWDRPLAAGARTTTIIGAPALPAITELIPLGANDGLHIEVEVLDAAKVSDLNILPFQPPAYRDGAPSAPFQMDKEIYNIDSYWPADFVTMGDPAIMHGARLVPVTFTPLRYNPASGDGLLVRKARVVISRGGVDMRNPLPDNSPGPSYIFNKILAPVMTVPANEEPFPFGTEPENGAYVIITDFLFLNQVKALAKWKERKGLSVEIYTTNETGHTPEKIKSFLKERYFSSTIPVDYVLLVGDIDQIPTFSGIDGGPADHIYATLEGDDYLPDVIIGRLPAQNQAEARTIIDKGIEYEKADLFDDSQWYSSALMISGSDKNDDDNASVTGKIIEEDGGFENIDYYLDSEKNNSLENVISSVEKGRSWITYFGHGSKQSWQSIEPELDNNHIKDLDNLGMRPVITSIACSNGAFDYKDDSFAEKWIKSDNGAGGAAIFAASRRTPFVYTDELGISVAEGYFTLELPTFGAAAVFGKLAMYNAFPQGPGGYTQMVMEHFHLFSDPELNVWSANPAQLKVNISATGMDKNGFILTVMAKGAPVKDALVHIYKGDFSITTRTDSNGLSNFTLPDDLIPEEVEITVTGRNVAPYLVDDLEPDNGEKDQDLEMEKDFFGACGG